MHANTMANTDTNGVEERDVLISEVEMHARVVLGVGKGVLFREVSSDQRCPYTLVIFTMLSCHAIQFEPSMNVCT